MRHLRRLGHCLAAGALAGAALLPLQLLLWPELDAPAGKLVLFAAAWISWATVWLGLAFFVLLELVALSAPFLASQPGISVGVWCWLLVGVGLLLTAAAWLNYRNTKDLLAVGRRGELEHAVAAAAVFSLLVLALVLARRPRRHALPLSMAASVLLLVWLWGSWLRSPADRPPAAIPGSAALVSHPPPILMVVWEAADLGVLLPAMERGDLPFLKERWGKGSWGQLRTLRPYARAAALTTLVTGCLPSEHGTAGRRVYRLKWLQAEPLSLLLEGPWPTPHQLPWRLWERAAAPPPRRATLWQILQGAGLRVGVVGWYAPARATWVVPRVLAAEASPYETLDSSLRTALAPALERSREFAGMTQEAFAVATEEFAQTRDRLRDQPVDALLVVSDLLGRLRPLWTAPAGDPAAAEVLRQALGLLDDQLATLWHALGGENVMLVVVSPYGMAAPGAWTRLRHALRGSRRWQVTPSAQADGFVFFAGPAVTRGARTSGARVADVTPTLLYMVDLPLAQDMSGKVLLEAIPEELAASRPLRLIPSYPNPDRSR
ncbi:MAG: alkaline phosphatase family protein [Acidobacteriota bacterium]|jgi:hypothetical protein